MPRLILLTHAPGIHGAITAQLCAPHMVMDAVDREPFLIDCNQIMGLQFYETWAEIILANGRAMSVHHPKGDDLIRLVYGDAPWS